LKKRARLVHRQAVSFAHLPPLGLGVAVDAARAAELAPLAERARFVEIAVDAALPDLEAIVGDDPFAPPPTVEEYYAQLAPPLLGGRALPCVAHAGATGPLSPAEVDHVARTVAARGARWLSAEAMGLSPGCALDPLPLPLTAATVDEMVARAAAFAARLGAVPFLVSSAPAPFAVGELHLGELLGAAASRADTGVRLDLGHLLAHQVARGNPPLHRQEALPLDRVVALRVSAGAISHTCGVAHFEEGGPGIAGEALALLGALVGRCPSLRAVILAPPAGAGPARDALDEVARLVAARGFQP
jgi:hypothetical protein